MKNKILTIISVIVVIIILFLARTIYSDHNLKKVIGACILAQTQKLRIVSWAHDMHKIFAL